MDVGWGAPLGERSDGQDILGVRGLDQEMEASLVVGITTISQRGRYLAILPWALGQFFAADAEAEAAHYDADRFRRFMFRVQFLTLACTTADLASGDGGGTLGSVLYGPLMTALRSGEAVTFPEQGPGAMLGTYFGPCRAIGLVRSGDAGRPYLITPRGKAIWEARNALLDASSVQYFIHDAKVISSEEALALAPHFSLKRLEPTSQEATLLREALLSPWVPSNSPEAAKVDDRYGRFNATLSWLREEAQEGLGTEDLLSRNWRRIATGNVGEESVRSAWAEFEWRRRVHFALELVLSAISRTLEERHQATLEEIVDSWLEEPDLAELVMEAWPGAEQAQSLTGREAADGVAGDLGLDDGISPRWQHLPGAHDRALAGFALLAALARQSADLRADGRFTDRERTGEQALLVIDTAGDEPFAETFARLAGVVARAHMANTFRKMAGGQKCSLRFFPEGVRLRSTGDTAGAGRSGPRLGNVIRILQDVGVVGLEAPA
jgi:hypothetical protein